MRWMVMLGLGCGGAATEPCECPASVRGHGVVLDGVCSCLPVPERDVVPSDGLVLFVDADAEEGGDGTEASPWAWPDWSAVDAALAAANVTLQFDAGDEFPERLEVLRTDTGPNRLTLRGSGENGQRARVPGILTPFEAVPRHRVTITGFEITGSRDKGIFWVGGDEVWIYDNVIHDNRGTPALLVDYSSRWGFASTDLRIVGNHVYDQVGECIYIGGSEGVDEESHVGLEVSHNLVHGCRHPASSQHDGINVKDRIRDVLVRRNVVVGGDWGIEVASAGLYQGNLSIDAEREGFHVSDGFQALPDMRFEDNVAIGSGDDGVQLTADRAPTGQVTFDGLTILDPGEIGFAVGGEHDVTAVLRNVAVQGAPVAFDGWGQGTIQIDTCSTAEVALEFDRLFEGQSATCDMTAGVPAGPVAGPDGLFFTEDDPWLQAGGARLSRE